jgi:hypothetical protein
VRQPAKERGNEDQYFREAGRSDMYIHTDPPC